MNQPSKNHRVLCVLVDPEDLPDAVRARLHQEDIDLEHRPDVFRGLARAGQWQPGVIILGADWLTPDELEFFDHVRRVAPSAVLFVFGDEQRAGSAYMEMSTRPGVVPVGLEALHDALRADHRRLQASRAEDLATTEKIPDSGEDRIAPPLDVLNASIETTGEPALDGDSTQPRSDEDALDDTAEWDVEDGLLGDEPFGGDKSAEDGDSGDSQPVRVPWLRYEERPQRTPPPKSPGEAFSGDESESKQPGSHLKRGDTEELDDDPPLLSTEELEALLGEGPIE